MSETGINMGPRQQVRCPCGHYVFDGIVVRSRVVRVLPSGGAEAMCRCKRWHPVPLTYSSAYLESGQSSLPDCTEVGGAAAAMGSRSWPQ